MASGHRLQGYLWFMQVSLQTLGRMAMRRVSSEAEARSGWHRSSAETEFEASLIGKGPGGTDLESKRKHDMVRVAQI